MNALICDKTYPKKTPSMQPLIFIHTREIKTKYIDDYFSERFKANYFNIKNTRDEYAPVKTP